MLNCSLNFLLLLTLFCVLFVCLLVYLLELKAQVSFSDRLLSVVRPSVFRLLLHNHWVNFNQIWHKASLDEGSSSLFKAPPPFFF